MELETALTAVGELLAAEGEEARIIILGGAALCSPSNRMLKSLRTPSSGSDRKTPRQGSNRFSIRSSSM